MATQREDIRFGTNNEINVLEQLQTYIGTTLQRNGGYAVMDYTNPGKTIYVELKTRRISHDTYPTTLIGANKVEFARKSNAECYFVWCFTDGLYYLKYDPAVWDSFETDDNYWRGGRLDCKNKAQNVVYVPANLLQRWEQ
jgi:hypothetical protein